MNVYNSNEFESRVNYAASVISKGKPVYNARHFDTCFEMNDGAYVGAALIRRILKNPNTNLARNLHKFINQATAMQNYETTKHLTRKQLREEAILTATTRRIA